MLSLPCCQYERILSRFGYSGLGYLQVSISSREHSVTSPKAELLRKYLFLAKEPHTQWRSAWPFYWTPVSLRGRFKGLSADALLNLLALIRTFNVTCFQPRPSILHSNLLKGSSARVLALLWHGDTVCRVRSLNGPFALKHV